MVGATAPARLATTGGRVDARLAREGRERGFATDLATVWRLARGWYAGRLDRGYVRREPAAAHEYMRSVGLFGSLGGL